MGWFSEQLSYRNKNDNEQFSEAIDSIAGAVMGKRLAIALDSREIASSAIDEILKYYGCKAKNDGLPKGVDSIDEQLEYQMRPFGIMRRRVVLDEGWYKYAAGAMLGTMKDSGDAVALIPGKFSGYSYLNLKTGKQVKLNRRNESILDEEAVCFYKPLPMKKMNVADLLKFMAAQLNISDVAAYMGIMAASALLGLLSPLFTKWLFGSVMQSGSMRALSALAVFMLYFTICTQCFAANKGLINSRINTKMNTAVQAAVMSRIINLPVSFFKDYASGELTQRASYVQSLCTMMVNSVGSTSISTLFSLIYIAQIYAFAPDLAAPSVLIILVSLVLSTLTTLVQIRITKEKMQLASKTSGLTYSTISGIQKIKLAGAEKRMFTRWAKLYAQQAKLEYDPPVFLKLGNTVSLAVTLLGTLLLYAAAIKSNVGVADYYAFNTAYAMVSAAFMELAGVAVSIANIKPSLEMVRPILETEPETSNGKEIVTSLHGGIELQNITFRYSDDMPAVIDDLSLKIKPGEYVAVVGATGCGKSTLMRLLLGFEKPQKGNIYYDRRDISKVDLKSLRRKIGTVMQDGKLFLGDIYSNIVIAAPQLTLDDAWRAAKIAAIDEDIRKMPMGMHTVISEGHGGISGGQRQRLMIARAVAPQPKILMFDEATSALDNITQKKVSDAIDSLKCTRIVIAHRLSTICHADRIIFLHNGKIVEDGTYEELIAKKGYFAELVERQRLDVTACRN